MCSRTLRDSFTHILVSPTSAVGIHMAGKDDVNSSFSIPVAIAAGNTAAAVNTELYPTEIDIEGPGYRSRYSDSLHAGQCGDRIPVGARFFVPVPTGPVAHPASYTMGTGSFPGTKRPGRGVDHPPHLELRLKEK